MVQPFTSKTNLTRNTPKTVLFEHNSTAILFQVLYSSCDKTRHTVPSMCGRKSRAALSGGIVGPTNVPTPSPSSVFPISQYLPPSTKMTSPFRALSVIRSPTERATSSGVLRPKPVGTTISSVTRPDFVQFGAMQLILMGTGNLEVCGSNPRIKPNTACFDVAKLCG